MKKGIGFLVIAILLAWGFSVFGGIGGSIKGASSVSPDLTGDVTISSTLGDELAPAMTAALWTEGTGWAIADGVATKTAGTGSTLVPTEAIVPVTGTNYKIVSEEDFLV